MENDKTIFKYLLPFKNENLSKLNDIDILELIIYINKYYLEYRDSLNIDKFNTFGIEVEMEHCWDKNSWQVYLEIREQLKKIMDNDKWRVVNDWSLKNGCELVSEILCDNGLDWYKIYKVCELANNYGTAGINCGSHIHIGSQIFGENTTYWKRFFKLWCVYENVIYRFCYGKDLGYRPNVVKYAMPSAEFYYNKLKSLPKGDLSVLELFRYFESQKLGENVYTKNYGLSYWRMLADDNYNLYEDFGVLNEGCTLEFRVCNGSFDEIIWQNDVNLFMKMMLYCKSDGYNEDIIDKRLKLVVDNFSNIDTYYKIYIDQVLEFSDLIFDNNLDKIYFLKQYLKNMDERNDFFAFPKKLTINDIK